MRWTEKDWWKGTRELVALHCAEADDGAPWRWLVLRRSGSQIETMGEGVSSSAGDLLVTLSQHRSKPIVVSFGHGFTLVRLLNHEQMANPIQGMLGPNARQEDFALQLIPASYGRSSVAAIRADALERITGLLADHSSRLVDVTFHPQAWAMLGPTWFENWDSQVLCVQAMDQQHWFTDGLMVPKEEVAGRNFSQHSLKEFSDKVGIASDHFPCWIAAAHFWTGGLKTIGWNLPASNRREHLAVSVMQKAATVMAGLLLLMALGLFGLQWRGNARKSALEREYLVSSPVLGAIDSMKAQVDRRAELLASLGETTLRPSDASRVLDRIGGIVPEEVALTELVIGPTRDELKKLGVDSIPAYNLLMRGAANDSWPVSKFGKRLEDQPWVETVHIWGSEMNFRTGDHEFTFLLKLKDAG